MKGYYFLKFFIAILATPIILLGQTATPNIADYSKISDVLPPAPNAASLGKYGGLDLSLASGMANINIPIYELASNNLKVPVSLSYMSNGFKVDELPGRVGSGWSLNAGGVITRSVFGSPDESYERLSPPSDFPARTTALVSFMEALSLTSSDGYGPDAQPDLFSFNFNGYSGRFILDANKIPVLLSHSSLKIEPDFQSTSCNFKITTPDGIQYLFGGSTATEKTKRSQTGTGCGKNYNAFIPTAWYLIQIIHPNNDVITFTYSPQWSQYSTGISEVIYERNTLQGYTCAGGTPNPPTLNNSICEGILQTSGVKLEEIYSTGGAKLKFVYSDRNDEDDKLLTAIELYQPGQTFTNRLFALTYQYGIASNFKNSFSWGDAKLNYHPFLIQFSEKSTDGLISKNHIFSYNDIASLPPRLSFAQDHYGYFNGKANITLIPTPSTLSWKQKLPLADANREVDPEYCKKGLLVSIKYPTGGKDSITYEPNQVYENVSIYPSQTIISASAYSPAFTGGPGVTSYSTSTFSSFQQEIFFTGQCISNSTTGGDPVHDQSVITLLDESDNIIYTNTLQPGSYFNEVLNLMAGHSYRIKCTSTGDKISGGATFYCMVGNIVNQFMNVNTGGVRVAKVITSDALTSIPIVKRFLYNKLLTPSISSGGRIYAPQYEKYLSVKVPCNVELPCIGNTLNQYDFYSMYSNSLNNIYIYPASPVSYSSVIESFGENFENGGIEHQYTVYADLPAGHIVGTSVSLAAPLTSYSWKNAREVYQHVFKLQGINYIPVKKVFTNYKEDPRVDQDFKAYVINKNYPVACNSPIPTEIEINAYDLLCFSYFRKWVYIDTVKTWNYDINGQNYLEQLNISEYANVTHALPTKQITYSSDHSTNNVIISYPQDITLSGTEETARQALISKYMIGTVLQQQVNKGTSQLFNLKTGYKVFPNGLVLPQTRYVQKNGYATEEQTKFYDYNNYGKILEQSKSSDIRQSYIWSNLSNYPLAQVINASSSEIAFTSFESEGTGGWVFSGIPVSEPLSPTGKYAYLLSSSVSKNGLTLSSYTVSFWLKNGSGTASVNSTTGSTGSNINGWTYYEFNNINPVSGTITVSGTGKIDELRLYPAKAQMTSYTYEPFVGISSQCDANNRISYYEYDAFNRLSIVRDQDRKIIKRICYNYLGQEGNCTTFGNVEKNGTYTKQCATGTGTQITYTVAANTYSSSSQMAADALAQNDINANGQNYANQNGTCSSAMVTVSATSYESSPFYMTFSNNATGQNYYMSLYPYSNNSVQVPAGNYTVNFNQSGYSVSTYFSISYYGSYGTSATFYSVSINSNTEAQIGY